MRQVAQMNLNAASKHENLGVQVHVLRKNGFLRKAAEWLQTAQGGSKGILMKSVALLSWKPGFCLRALKGRGEIYNHCNLNNSVWNHLKRAKQSKNAVIHCIAASCSCAVCCLRTLGCIGNLLRETVC